MAVNPTTGTVFVTGFSDGSGTGFGYATVAYQLTFSPQKHMRMTAPAAIRHACRIEGAAASRLSAAGGRTRLLGLAFPQPQGRLKRPLPV